MTLLTNGSNKLVVKRELGEGGGVYHSLFIGMCIEGLLQIIHPFSAF